MRTITRCLVILSLLVGVGCDADEPLAEPAGLESIEQPIDLATPETVELGEYGWTELATASSPALDVAQPPAEGTCGGYWETSGTADFQGCGSCVHTIPEPDRPGNLGLWYRRWCWTGPGCSGCEPWVVVGAGCYDWCS